MMEFRGAAVTINNPTAAHYIYLTKRRSGHCNILDRLRGRRVTIFIGKEKAPTTGTEHIRIGLFSEIPMTKLAIQRLFTPYPMDYELVRVGSDWPAADKGPTHWEEYCSKEEALPTIHSGLSILDEEYATWLTRRITKTTRFNKEIHGSAECWDQNF